ncbi:uncharacterized protein LOC127775392 isoform X1 [Oryza glaberrima]|uniref:uncharacterized protein LOC127775392 isoform X1 n=1 Tax=Oryza glaberrima TaxID=4538 RepID=UPI00224BFD36|nr:uncharacterized protein LOC127775392 isoform X1 [Oryza glaberrima]
MGRYHDGKDLDTSSYPLIAVCIDKDKNSQNALKWAIDTLVQKGQIIVLVHVNTKGTSGGVEDASGFKQPTDPHMRDLYLPFRCFCTRKDVSGVQGVRSNAAATLILPSSRSRVCACVRADPVQGRAARRPRRGQVHHRVLRGRRHREARRRRHGEGRVQVQGRHPDHHLQGRAGLLHGVRHQQGEGVVGAELHPPGAARVAAPVADPEHGGRRGEARAGDGDGALAAEVVVVVEGPRPPGDAQGGQLHPLAVRARPDGRRHAQVVRRPQPPLHAGLRRHLVRQLRPPQRRAQPRPGAPVRRLGRKLRPQLRDVAHAVGRRLLRRQRPHLLLPEQHLLLLLHRHGRRGDGDEEASAGAEADHGHVQHGVQGGAEREAEGDGAAAVEGGGGAEDARREADGGVGDGADRAGEGQGEGRHGRRGGVAADRRARGAEADHRGEEAPQGGRGPQEPRRRRRRHVARDPLPPLQHRGDRARHRSFQRRAQDRRGRLRPGVQGPPRPHGGRHQGAPPRRGAGEVAVPARGGGAQLHPPPEHGAPPRRLPGVRLPRVRVHGERQPRRLPVPARRRRRRRRAGDPVAAPVPHRRGDRHGPPVPPPDEAGAAGAPRPQARQHPPRPQLRQQDQRRRAGAARAAERRRQRDAVPDDVDGGDVLLHRPGVPADGDARRQVGRVLAGRDAAPDHHGQAADGAHPPRRPRHGARRARRHARPGRPRLARRGGAVPRRDGAPLLRAPPQGQARPRLRRAPGAQPASRARRGQHAVLRRHQRRRWRRLVQFVPPQHPLALTSSSNWTNLSSSPKFFQFRGILRFLRKYFEVPKFYTNFFYTEILPPSKRKKRI